MRRCPDCLITGYQSLVPKLDLPDLNDRHVLAAAIVGGVDIIVTANLRDFPAEKLKPFGIEARHPDDFIVNLFDLSESAVVGAVRKQRARLKAPPVSAEELLGRLANLRLVMTVERLTKFIKQL